MSTETITRPIEAVEVEPDFKTTDEPGDASHIVMVPEGEPDQTPQAYVLRARIEGFPITALCGYTWVPTKDPKDKAVCSKCVAIYQQPGEDRESRDNLPDA